MARQNHSKRTKGTKVRGNPPKAQFGGVFQCDDCQGSLDWLVIGFAAHGWDHPADLVGNLGLHFDS
jgi:hypothetical protein